MPIESKPAPVPAPSIAIDSKAAALHNQRGRELLYQGKYAQAISELTQAIQSQPDLALAFNARGFAYYLSRDYTHAVADLDQAIQLNPNYQNAYHNRSLARKAAGDSAGSAADLAKERALTKP